MSINNNNNTANNITSGRHEGAVKYIGRSREYSTCNFYPWHEIGSLLLTVLLWFTVMQSVPAFPYLCMNVSETGQISKHAGAGNQSITRPSFAVFIVNISLASNVIEQNPFASSPSQKQL